MSRPGRTNRLGPLLALIASGCTAQPSPPSFVQNSPALAADVQFGFGAPAPEQLISAWDIDVRPDGRGLPPGSGSVTQGQALYRVRCAHCHGTTGREGPNDRLVGEAVEGFPFGQSADLRGRRVVGNYWPYATTLFDYIRRAMPFDSPGTLTPDQIYGAVAYVLFLNGLIQDDSVMDASTLPAVQMPARDRFVPDDRVGGPVIR